MRDSFSFCGIDIEELGFHYAPENKDTYVYKPTKMNVHEETFEGHDGGYVYGAYKEPKEFILRCYYEDEHIAQGLMAYLHKLFAIGKSGLLIFNRRPWCYYYATVTNINTDDMYNYLNGLIVITMKAYYPFARGVEINDRLFSNRPNDPYHEEIMQNTALLENDNIVPPMSFNTVINPNQTGYTILLFNPGTERAKLNLVVAGKAGNGITIYNKTTDQDCKYVAFDTTTGVNTGGSITTDGFNGKTVLKKNDGSKTLAFLYHDHGFIELEPAFPIMRNIFATYNGDTVTTTNILYSETESWKQDVQKVYLENINRKKEWYTDKYIYLDAWYKIKKCVDQHTLEIYPRDSTVLPSQNNLYPGEGQIKTSIVSMNEINLHLSSDARLTKLNFIYKPTYS